MAKRQNKSIAEVQRGAAIQNQVAYMQLKITDPAAARVEYEHSHAEAIAEDVNRVHHDWIRVTTYLENECDRCREDIETFAKKLSFSTSSETRNDAEPARTLAWGSDVITSAARLDVYSGVLHGLKTYGPRDLYRTIVSEALRSAEDNGCSTSQITNLLERARTAAWARLSRAYEICRFCGTENR